MVDFLVREPLVNVFEFIFGCFKCKCFVFFVNVCMEVAYCIVVYADGDSS